MTQEVEDVQPYSVAPQQMQLEDRSSLAIAVDPAKLLFQIEHSLKGEAQDDNGNWVNVREPLANKEGVGAILVDLSSKLSHNTTLTNLEKEEIGILMKAISRRVRLMIVQNYKRYDIKVSDFTLLKDLITEPIFFTLRRALKQGERHFWQKTTSEQRTIIDRPQPKRGLLDGIFNKPQQ